jgi:hypothetical protein
MGTNYLTQLTLPEDATGDDPQLSCSIPIHRHILPRHLTSNNILWWKRSEHKYQDTRCIYVSGKTYATQIHIFPSVHIYTKHLPKWYMECLLKYVGRPGRNFRTKCMEHTQAIWNNNSNLWYPKHILNTEHAYGCIILWTKFSEK